ncbi:hypothetical protein DL98DRAFT_627225 [Cadophora sp. DSE1049]|nr:hypothetical protein DL98DRAFT_627225 [Cadophora sp. DSE1049]
MLLKPTFLASICAILCNKVLAAPAPITVKISISSDEFQTNDFCPMKFYFEKPDCGEGWTPELLDDVVVEVLNSNLGFLRISPHINWAILQPLNSDGIIVGEPRGESSPAVPETRHLPAGQMLDGR